MNPLLAPEVILTVCGLLLLLWEAFGRPAARTMGWACIGAYVLAGLFMLPSLSHGGIYWDGLYTWDKSAIFFKFFFLLAGLLVSYLSLEYQHRLPVARGEFFILPLFASAGMLLLASVNDFILLFVALELVTVSFYILVGFQRNNPTALEAAVKYLIMGALSSAFLVMGIAYVFGVTASTQFQVVKGFIEYEGVSAPLVFGLVMILVGLGFKVAAVPFHIWAPDVYQGAPTPVTAFLGVASKAAGFVLLLRIFDLPFSSLVLQPRWIMILGALAVASLILGNLAALPQRNIKRLLAYSGISHAGFLLVALAANSATGHAALLFYLASYLLASFVAFLVVTVLAQDANGEALHQFSGLSQRSPLLAWSLALAFVSMAGIPPLVGFFGKYLVFLAAWEAQQYVLVTVGVLAASAGLYYYIGVVRTMFWAEPISTEAVTVSLPTRVVLVTLCAAIVILGFYAQPLLQLVASGL